MNGSGGAGGNGMALLLFALGVLVALGALSWRWVIQRRARVRVRASLRAALHDPDPAVRSAGIAEAGTQGLSVFADLLLRRAMTERDPSVKRVLAATIARHQWEPLGSEDVVKLRLWAHQHLDQPILVGDGVDRAVSPGPIPLAPPRVVAVKLAAPTEAAPTEAAPTEAAPTEAAPTEATAPLVALSPQDGAPWDQVQAGAAPVSLEQEEASSAAPQAVETINPSSGREALAVGGQAAPLEPVQPGSSWPSAPEPATASGPEAAPVGLPVTAPSQTPEALALSDRGEAEETGADLQAHLASFFEAAVSRVATAQAEAARAVGELESRLAEEVQARTQAEAEARLARQAAAKVRRDTAAAQKAARAEAAGVLAALKRAEEVHAQAEQEKQAALALAASAQAARDNAAQVERERMAALRERDEAREQARLAQDGANQARLEAARVRERLVAAEQARAAATAELAGERARSAAALAESAQAVAAARAAAAEAAERAWAAAATARDDAERSRDKAAQLTRVADQARVEAEAAQGEVAVPRRVPPKLVSLRTAGTGRVEPQQSPPPTEGDELAPRAPRARPAGRRVTPPRSGTGS